ncbi:pentatricopeptide repeat-containing protein At2g17033 isoform X2 [Cornus florida]|uniref:pentatricopeptide repeat-containing protein At2g17033 isoform X2 n=1 Tax=Cornus florida TaxID=4283 RepID=UPI0028A1A9A1|nr:pentatricopeptide repeat-containing protein At2g17033 isoform X2 [Cornus florida]
MIVSLQLSLPLSWRYRHQQPPPPQVAPILTTLCFLSKQGKRLLSSLATTSAAGDSSAANRLIRKFFYMAITEASWFSWNPKLVAELIALLDKQGQLDKSQILVSETVSKLGFRERVLAQFYCYLIDSHSKHKSKQGFFDSCTRLKQLLSNSYSVFVKLRAYESMVGGLCVMDLPREAEGLVGEMRDLGLKPGVFEFRSLVHAYGRLGLFEDMKRSVVQMESEGFGIDTVCSNMVLSSFGAYTELSEMVSWLRRMKNSSVPFSARTYNSVLNSSPTIMSMLQEPKRVPLSVAELTENLHGDDALLVHELIGSSVLEEAMEWDSLESKLDMHGMHLGCAYLIMLQWKEELHSRFHMKDSVIPAEITVVCGSGKHSTVRGESPVKSLVKEMMLRMKCPMRIDRKNVGCFVGKGRVVKEWLC